MQGGELADVTTRDVVQAAVQSLDSLVGRVFDVVAVTKSVTSDAALQCIQYLYAPIMNENPQTKDLSWKESLS